MGQRTLRTWICGPATTAASELEARAALRARLLTPQETTPAEYGTRLADQARRASEPNMRTYPVVLLPGETALEDDVLFRNWVERARQLPSLDALRASFSEVDVRLERRPLFEYAKVKTKRLRLRHGPQGLFLLLLRAMSASTEVGARLSQPRISA
jgi:hypothetical protein